MKFTYGPNARRLSRWRFKMLLSNFETTSQYFVALLVPNEFKCAEYLRQFDFKIGLAESWEQVYFGENFFISTLSVFCSFS